MVLPEKVRIESDGKSADIIAPDGTSLTKALGVAGIVWSIEPRNIPRATIQLVMTETRVDVDRVFYAIRIGKEFKEITSIKFRDGSELIAPEVSERLQWPFPTL